MTSPETKDRDMTAQADILMEGDGPAPIVRLPAPSVPRPSVKAAASGQVVDLDYTLWLATTATSLMGALCLTLALVLYLIDSAISLSGGASIFTFDNYRSMLELSAIFALLAVGAHMLRLRLEAMRRATIVIPLPFRIVIEPPIADTKSRFECSCKVSLALDHDGPVGALTSKPDVLKRALETAFIVAVTDPVIRFSKQKMEQTLKTAASSVLGPGVSYIEMSEVRQRRLPAHPPAPVVVSDEPAAVPS